MSEILSDWMKAAFAAAFPEVDTAAVSVAETANPEFGDYQCNAAMALGKRLGKSPRDVATAAVGRAGEHGAVEKIDIAGPGFINLYLKNEWLCRHLERLAGSDRLGVPLPGEGKTVVMDYGSPNMTKPLHIGHLRSPNIGSALDRIHRLLGYKVIADNHLGDWGTQFGITIMGYRHFGDREAMKTQALEELERVYVKSYEKCKTDQAWLSNCREELVKLQQGDPENTALWQEFMALSRQELDRIYSRLGVSFDIVRGESHYSDRLGATVELLEKRGLAKQSEGATVVFLEEEKLPVCMVRKSDGGFNYATTDIATVLSRMEEFGPDSILYVTDERQQLHFKQFFAVCGRLGCDVDLRHVWFGLMRLPEGTFSTREGTVIRLEEVLDEAEERALAIVRESSPDMPESEQKEVARAVGIGAVKYADLSQNPQSLVTFTWDKAMALDGNSGPYLQYAYARIASVRDKYCERFADKNPDEYPLIVSEPIERLLMVKLARFGDVVARAAESCKPNVLTDYMYDLAQTYSSFYQNVPFLKADEGLRESRVRLCGMVAGVLGKGLELTGIQPLSRI